MAIQRSLRRMIERNGLYAVLDTLSGICGIEAERTGNADWERAEAVIEQAVSIVLDLNLKDDGS